MVTILRVGLEGDDAHLGEVPAADVGRLLIGAERMVAKASGHVLRRQVRPTGRWGSVIEQSVRFRLVSLGENSVVGILQLPDPPALPDGLELDAESLGELALGHALRTAAELEQDFPDVAGAIVDWAEDCGVGTRYTGLRLEAVNGAPMESILVDTGVVERLRVLSARLEPDTRDDTVTGILYEADFERDRAHIRTATGDNVVVDYPPELRDDIYLALRHRASLLGEVDYDPVTAQVKAIHLREIREPEQLTLRIGPEEFRHNSTVEELQVRQHVGPITSLEAIQDTSITDEEAAAFLEAMEH